MARVKRYARAFVRVMEIVRMLKVRFNDASIKGFYNCLKEKMLGIL